MATCEANHVQDTVLSKTDYEKTFLPFPLKDHTVLATDKNTALAGEKAEVALQRIGSSESMPGGGNVNKTSLSSTFAATGATRYSPGVHRPSVKALMGRMNGSEDTLIDLNSSEYLSALQRLEHIPIKFLKYHEDVRPPWIGTFTRLPSTSITKLCRNPFSRAFSSMDYDVDSEAEWEVTDEGEGEDLVSEGEDEDEDEDDDMTDFIDDEGMEQTLPKRRKMAQDLKPLSTGIYWEEDHESSVVPYGDGTIDMARFRFQSLLRESQLDVLILVALNADLSSGRGREY